MPVEAPVPQPKEVVTLQLSDEQLSGLASIYPQAKDSIVTRGAAELPDEVRNFQGTFFDIENNPQLRTFIENIGRESHISLADAYDMIDRLGMQMGLSADQLRKDQDGRSPEIEFYNGGLYGYDPELLHQIFRRHANRIVLSKFIGSKDKFRPHQFHFFEVANSA